MKYLPLLWSGIWRNPTRAVLTFLSVVVAFALFGVLAGLSNSFTKAQSTTRNNIVIAFAATMDMQNFSAMPLSYRQQIERVDGVQRVLNWGGFLNLTWQIPSNQVPAFSAPPDELLLTYPEITLPPEQLEAWRATPQSVIVPRQLMDRFGWKLGERLSFQSQTAQKDGSTDWAFDIAGIYDAPSWIGINGGIISTMAFMDKARAEGEGTAFEFDVTIDNPERAAEISTAIDALFENSAVPTRTRPFAALNASFAQSFDIRFFVQAVVAAGFFVLLLLTANSMAEAVRERTAEFAVLKTLGFSPPGVFALVLLEALIPCLAGAVLGLVIARVVIPLTGPLIPIFQFWGVELPWTVMAAGVGFAVLVALVSSLAPAARVARLAIADELAGR